MLAGLPRPWQIGVLWDKDDRVARPLIAALKARGDYPIGENEPYSGRARIGNSIEIHADAGGLPGVLIEVREDMTADPADAARMGDVLADALAPVLAESALYRRKSR